MGEEERRIRQIMDRLNAHFEDRPMEFLTDREPWKLLLATILSAQCTDARVNQVTKVLYQHYPRLEDIAAASQEEIEREIYTTGFYHNKARNLRACAQALLLRFDGTVPDEMEALLTLPGVGRKTANLILGEIYGKPSIVVDTHVKRVSRRLGLVTATDPTKVVLDSLEYAADGARKNVLHGKSTELCGLLFVGPLSQSRCRMTRGEE